MPEVPSVLALACQLGTRLVPLVFAYAAFPSGSSIPQRPDDLAYFYFPAIRSALHRNSNQSISKHELVTRFALLISSGCHRLHQRWLAETQTGLMHFRGISVFGRDALKEDVQHVSGHEIRVSPPWGDAVSCPSTPYGRQPRTLCSMGAG